MLLQLCLTILLFTALLNDFAAANIVIILWSSLVIVSYENLLQEHTNSYKCNLVTVPCHKLMISACNNVVTALWSNFIVFPYKNLLAGSSSHRVTASCNNIFNNCNHFKIFLVTAESFVEQFHDSSL